MAKDDESPEIPTWEALGISPEELAELEKELDEAGGEGDEEDLLAGLDLSPSVPPEVPSPASTTATAAAAAAAGAGRAKKPDAPKAGGSKSDSTSDKTVRAAKPGLFARLMGRGKGTTGSAKGKDGTAKAKEPTPKAKKGGPATQTSGGGGDGSNTSSTKGPTLGPAPRYRGLITVGVLLAVGWMARWDRASPSPLPDTAPDTVFSADRAVAHLSDVARAAHPPGSPEHARVRGYLVQQLTALGLTPQIQTTTEVVDRGTRATAATVRNIVARIPGTASTGAVLVTAHYDGREISPGAGDDGAGVVTILEAVRALQAGGPLQNDIIVLITDAEELGLLGARAFVDQHPWMGDVRLVLSIEMRGGGGPSIMFETGRENGWVVQQYAQASPAPTHNSMSFEVYKRLPNDTDFSPFRDAGVQGLNFAAIGRAHVYHQQYDNAENLSDRTVQHHGVQALALLKHFGSADLTGSLQAPDRVHFSLPFLGTISYAPWISSALSAVLLLLAGIVVVIGRKRGARTGGIAAGCGIALLLVGVAAGLGYGLAEWLPRFHPEVGALHGSQFHSEGWYVLALGAAVIAVCFGALAIGKKWFSVGELAIGAALIPALAGIATGPTLPMAAMNFQWPAMAALVGAGLVSGVGRSERVGLVGWILLLVLAIPVVVFMVPLIEVLWLAMNISLAPVLGGLMAISMLGMFALTDVGREPSGWTATGGALVAGVVLLAVGLGMSRPSESRPAPSTLIYTLDNETGASRWAMNAVLMQEGEADLSPGLEWAVERAGAPDQTASLQAFTGSNYGVATAPAPSITTAQLALGLVTAADSTTVVSLTPGGTATVRVRSVLGAEQLAFILPESGVRVRAINGRPLPNGDNYRAVWHWGEPDGAVELELQLPPSGNAQFAVVEHHFRPAELVGAAAFTRPPELAPNINRLSDRAMIRTAVVIDLATGAVSFPGGGEPAEVPAATTAPLDSLSGVVVEETGATDLSAPANPTGTIDLAAGAPVVALFGRDRISSVEPEFATTFAPDGRTAYFNRTSADRTQFSLLASILSGDTWSAPEPVPFSGTARDIDPFVTPDGDRLFFSSNRPRAGVPDGVFSTWYVDRTPSGWSEPIDPGPPFNSDTDDIFVSAARDGTTVFRSERGGQRRIYQTRPTENGWAEPTVIRFGSVEVASNPLISPDGQFIVFVLDGPFGGADLYVSCRQAEGWAAPLLLPEPINSGFSDFAPALHPDGSLLFTSERPGILGPVPEGVRPAGDLYTTVEPLTPCG